tara:strand:+ start:706 stop:930 length:225 start_codon:yes stop_codon:yes gene_type:complete
MNIITQQKIATTLGVSQPFIHQVLTGKKKISWPMAEKLSNLFPSKTMQQWKRVDPDVIWSAFEGFFSTKEDKVA